MCFGSGGGGSGGGNDRSYYDNIDRDIRIAAEDRQRRLDEEAAARNELARTKAAGAKSTYGQALGQRYFSDLGLPADQSLIDEVLNSISIPEGDLNPEQYITREAFAGGVNAKQDTMRNRMMNTVDSTFTPGFERGFIADTVDDSILNSILGTQRTQAQTQLDFNKKRGLLNDMGYNTALGELNTQAGAGMSTLDQIGQSIIGTGRQKLSDIRGEAGNYAANWRYGAPELDVGNYYHRAGLAANDFSKNLEGSIRGALGDTNLFDVGSILQKGGIAQGPINLTTAGSDTSGFGPLDQKKNKSRGLGGSGVF